MCGIFGIWHRDGKPVDLLTVRKATTLLRHRGPDDEGYLLVNTQTGCVVACGGRDTDSRLCLPSLENHLGESYDLVLGFRRLSILDLSQAGHQPMSSADGRCWIVFNGEIYNYLELREELSGYGYQFRTGTDTEVILAAYQQWGAECLSRFNGMWAFAIWDTGHRHLFCARDRFGVKPFYHAFFGPGVVFGSEIKALLCVVPARPNLPIVKDYLARGILNYHPEQTFFEGIFSLAPGSGACLKPCVDRPSISRFWELPSRPVTNATPTLQDASQEIRSLLTDSVRLRLRSDVPVGSSLSGGLDSSGVVCVANRMLRDMDGPNLGGPPLQHTVSSVYENSPLDERPWIQKVVEHTGVQAHFTFPAADGLRHEIEKFIWHLDEPVLGSSAYAQWCVFREARRHGLTVMLDGQGSDELFAGYEPMVSVYAASLLEQGRLVQAWRELRKWQRRNAQPIRHLLRQTLSEIKWLAEPYALLGRRGRYDPRWAALHPELVRQAGLSETFADMRRGEIAVAGKGHLHAVLLRTLTTSSLPQILRQLDRDSMAFSVEAREPYLDYRLVWAGFHLPDDFIVRDGWTKFILRQALAGAIPDAIRWRPDKLGFPVPESTWYRGPLASLFEGVLASESLRQRGWMDQSQVLSLYKEFRRGNPAIQAKVVWGWLNLEIWARLFLDSR